LRYRTCIRIAEGNYSATWTQQCKKISDRASKDYKDCLSKGTFDKATCDTLYSERDASPDCALPRTIGTDISDILDKARRAFLDPSRLGTTLAAFAGKFGDGYTQRAAEAVKTYRNQNWLAACVMAGAAAESILLAVAIAKIGDEKKVLTTYNGAGGRSRTTKLVTQGVTASIRQTFETALGVLHYWRDDAAHGMAAALGETEAHEALSRLLRLAQFATKSWTQLTGSKGSKP
jgi:hypothetical protein